MSQNSNQTLEFFCPKCNQRLRAANRLAGQRLVCPKCQQSVKVPGIQNSQNDDAQWLDLDAPAETPVQTIHDAAGSSPDDDVFALETPKPSTKPAPVQPPTQTNPPDDDDLPSLAPASPSTAANEFASDLFASIRLDDFPPPTTPDRPAPSNRTAPSSRTASAERTGNPGMATPSRKTNSDAALDAQTETHDSEYRITCRTCGTPQYVPVRKQGKAIRCPDCHSEFVVPPPPPNWNPKAKTSKASAKQVDHEVSLAADSGPVAATPEPTRLSAQEYLSKAEQANIDEQMDSVYNSSDFDSQEFIRRNFQIFRDLSVWGHAIALGLLTGISMAVLLGLHDILADKIPTFVVDILGLIVGSVVVCLHFTCGYALVDAGAHRRTTVRFWPLGNFKHVLGDGMPVLAASVLSALPGLFLCALMLLAGISVVAAIIPAFLFFWALFPVILLSMLNSESISTPFSAKVFASFGPAKEEWGAAYLKMGIVSFIAFLVISVGLTNVVIAVLSGIALPIALFYLYFQTGFLGSSIAQHLDVDIGQSDDNSASNEALPL